MTQYSRGSDFERSAMRALEADGYFVVRSAGSKGAADLVALKSGQALLVQCKLNGVCPPAERADLIRLAQTVGALPIVAHKVKGKSKVLYRLLLGHGPKDFAIWNTDELNPTTELDLIS